ncbi:hypothetical protein Q8F55_006647 [Vanrija albida]|uniref:N-acetyltransferase domain-containing protein n=1 Tax=Vanrija albida TaxID=181172 RepID=A0ABR3PXU8_9TREE
MTVTSTIISPALSKLAPAPAAPAPAPTASAPAPAPTPVVHWDAAADEPYLELPGIPGYRLTPHRFCAAEEDDLIELSNMPEVARWSYRRPYPYDRGHARAWIETMNTNTRDSVDALKADPSASVPVLPFVVVRDPNGRVVGDVGIWKEADEMRPYARSLGYTLHPKLHRRGIGSASVGTVIAWARDRLDGAKVIDAGIEVDNEPSQALVAKLGFTKVMTKSLSWPEDKGGGERTLGVWRLHL